MGRSIVVASLCLVIASARLALAAPPVPDHVVIVIEENHAYSQVIGSPSATYMNSLAAAGANFTNFYSITHPSQPNYLHIFSGSNQGITNDTVPPAGAPYSTPNLGAALLAAGATFGGYSEDLPFVGSTASSSGTYMRKHNPWVDWQVAVPGLNQLPPSVNMPFTSFPADYSTLPKVSFVVPNQANDMHDGTVLDADNWLIAHISPYATWAQTHNSLLILCWDEDDSSTARNRIPTVFYGPMVTPGQTISSVWTNHNLLRTLEDMYGTSHSGSAASVRSIAGVFTTDPPTATKTFQNGVAGYTDTHDTWIESANPNLSHATDLFNVVDSSPISQSLIRFDNIVGSAATQIPPGATVLSAKVMLLTGSLSGDHSANTAGFYRMKTNWTDASTWNSLVGGVSLDDVEAAASSDFILTPAISTAWAIFDVTGTLQGISDGSITNYGWLANPGGADNWRWASAETAAAGDRPILSVTIDLSSCRPIISQPPVNQHAIAGSPLVLSVTASATTPLTYQWRKDLTPLTDGAGVSGSNTATLTVDPSAVGDTGSYDVIVTSNCGPVTSSAAQALVCAGPATGDMDNSGVTDGLDIAPFITAVLAGSTAQSDLCPGDFSGNSVMDANDIDPFISALVN